VFACNHKTLLLPLSIELLR